MRGPCASQLEEGLLCRAAGVDSPRDEIRWFRESGPQTRCAGPVFFSDLMMALTQIRRPTHRSRHPQYPMRVIMASPA